MAKTRKGRKPAKKATRAYSKGRASKIKNKKRYCSSAGSELPKRKHRPREGNLPYAGGVSD
jgi:hypothetical protein